jgi:putative FmdB family regulatory protein
MGYEASILNVGFLPDRRLGLPLYEYRCKKCGEHVEKIQKFSDLPLSTCEKCGGKLERLISSPAIQFKGSGWYVTDYARKSTTPAASAAESPSNGDGKKAAKPEKEAAKVPASKS